MALSPRRSRPKAKPAAPAPRDMKDSRPLPAWVDITDVHPYEFNARDNAKAVEAVARSISTFGFLVPIVIDMHGNLAAGHTRIEAAKSLGMTEVLALRVEHLSPAEFDAFRLVDNKVSELADWNPTLLGPELSRLAGLGFEFTEFGWTAEEVDCLSQVVASDCLSAVDLGGLPQTQQAEGEQGVSIRRGPQSTRLVLGEIVLFIPTQVYRDWVDGLQRFVNFDKAELEAEIKNRLRIME